MAPEQILLDRPRLPATPPPLDWSTLADAFEAACLLRCTPPPAVVGTRRPAAEHRPPSVEFNREEAAHRMRQLLHRLDVPIEHEVTVGGLRRRFELHRLSVPHQHRPAYARTLEAGWRQGRRELLGGPVPGASTVRRAWRPRLAAAAWRAALLAGGRHVRRHILGVRITDRELAAILVRGAALLDVPALLRPGTGCYLVCVADGPDRQRILHSTALDPAHLRERS
ncbi:hypothetical protein ACLQ20_23755 [Micromonospora sp. DT46]|uniref:hypothetical protein n=1 Tax=unclassified Micromonospora TaxID=2617518 RepID=UPI00124B584B|nr:MULTISPECIES: hypothetical protein [unclassified Micromonospora]KAB1155656.1 hypothetical protein F6X68_12175 [Micromonospora sp. AMSO12t]WSG05277.1 hypothetical protein OG989_16985 [Micromonospora sp. NBC_01740]